MTDGYFLPYTYELNDKLQWPTISSTNIITYIVISVLLLLFAKLLNITVYYGVLFTTATSIFTVSFMLEFKGFLVL